MTVGGRTSAVVEALQKLPEGMAAQLDLKKQSRASKKAKREVTATKDEEAEGEGAQDEALELEETVCAASPLPLSTLSWH